MTERLELHPGRLFPSHASTRGIAQRLYRLVADKPIISPHGHTDPRWFADNEPFSNAADLLLTPDHYLFRMLFSRGIPLSVLGVPRTEGACETGHARDSWRTFAQHYYLFRDTPSRLWLDWVFANVFNMTKQLDADTADDYFDAIGERTAANSRRSPAYTRPSSSGRHGGSTTPPQACTAFAK